MDRKNTKIFLIEDDFMIRDLYEQAFRMMGYRIEVAIDGQDGVDKLDYMKSVDELPILILLDLMMPRMNGFDVLRHISLDNKLKDILVVVLTSVDDKQSAENAIKAGADSYLIKSDNSPRQVVELVQQTIDKSLNKINIR